MKNILILLFSVITVFGYSQTQINPSGQNTVANINTAIKGSINAIGTNTYTATMSGFTWTSGQAMDITFVNANTETSTFNLNGAGALTLKKESSGSLVDLVPGDIIAGARRRFYHNGTYLVMQSGGGGSGGGTVTDVSVTTANGVSGSVANATTTPAITLTLGAITPSTVNGITFSGSSTPSLAITGTSTISGTHSGSSSGTNTGDDVSQNRLLTHNRQTASYQLVLTDKDSKLVEMNVASANNVTVPLNSTVAFPIGSVINIVQYGAGITSIVGAGGVTIRTSSGSLSSPSQYAAMTLEKVGTDEWYLWNGTTLSGQPLTKTDDTNITLTLGGSSSTALINAASVTAGWTGQLSTTRGGTGTSTPDGTYTPTITSVANVDATTAYQCNYIRIGSSVTVSGKVDIDPTTNTTSTQIGISLPIASNLAANENCAGTGNAPTVVSLSGAILGDATNDRAQLQFVTTATSNTSFYFTFTYRIQ